MQISLSKSLESGKKRIEVQILKGKFFFRNNHISIDGIDKPDVRIRIVGKKCQIIPEGRKFMYGEKISGFLDYRNSYISSDGEDISVWTPFHATDTLIKVVNKSNKLCKLHVPLAFSGELANLSRYSYIQFTEWYYTRVCKIDSISDGYVYFKVPELFYIKDGYNVNYDYRWHRRMPRYRFFDSNAKAVLFKDCHSVVYEGEEGSFCLINNTRLNSLSIEGLEFLGSHASKYLLNIKNSSFEDYFLLYNCKFKGQKGKVVNMAQSYNMFIQHCNFSDQYAMVIDSDMASKNTEICYNTFNNCGIGMSNSFCVRCRGDNYLISYNDFCNFGYGAIGVGISHTFENPQKSCGVVEYNRIYNTDNYLENIDQRGLIDGGAIYLWTINDGSVIRYNFINNISGAGSNRGIYCDDGAKNFVLYGNVIMNVKNSRAIDARYDTSLEDHDSSQIANINKEMFYNITDGSVKLNGRPSDENGCRAGFNFIAGRSDCPLSSDYSELEWVGDDYTVISCSVFNGKVVLDSHSRKLLKKTPVYKQIKKFIH